MRWFLPLLALFVVPVQAQGVAPPQITAADADALAATRAADMRLATLGYRLSVANAPLCDRLEPGHGIQFLILQLYPPSVRSLVASYFKVSGPVGVLDVVADSPAARAGVQPGDTITRFGSVAIPKVAEGPASTDQLAQLWTAVAQLPPDAPIDVAVVRGGVPHHLTITPVRACRTRYELSLSRGMDAAADGEYVRISNGYLARFPGDLLAPVVAHELAHNMLHHRERLDGVGAKFGMLSGLGRNLGYFRQAEIEADTLAVHLLARAGFPADTASQFRQHPAAKSMSGVFQARSHPHWRDRLRIAVTQEAVIAAARAANGGALPPAPFINTRDQPLTGEWRPLVPPS